MVLYYPIEKGFFYYYSFKGKKEHFNTIGTCTSILMEDLLFHFRLYLLHYLLMNQNISALLDYDVLTLISANNSASSTAHPHS